MRFSESIKNISIALGKFQGEITNPTNTATNPFFKSKYAPLHDVINHIRPLLKEHGLSIIQSTGGVAQNKSIYVTTLLIHASGEFIESDPLEITLEKATAQGAGSSITYARRYSLSAVLNISSEEDNDANHPKQAKQTKQSNTDSTTQKPTPKGVISEPQRKRMFAIANSHKISTDNVKLILEAYGYESSKDIKTKDYENICEQIENFVTAEMIQVKE